MELDDYDECKDLALYTFNRQYAIGMTPDTAIMLQVEKERVQLLKILN